MKQNFNEIKQNWNFYMCTIDEKAASIRLNFALTEIAPVEDYTHRLTIFIKMNNPTEDGLSSNEEYPILCDIEDEVVDRLETLEDIFAGTVKTQGRLELYLFTKNPEKSEELCKEALAKFPDYLWKTYIDEDKEWDFYYNFLYPDVYSYQTIMNRSVIENLLENEDKLEKEREIDHWLYFKIEENANLAIKKFEELGYEIKWQDMSFEEAAALAKEKSGNAHLTEADLRQDEDALDTWFSSWLWPMSVFNGILEPNNPEIEYYYPTNDLVTGPDILFFWVTRMIVAGYEYKGERPFSNVYLTGLVRDKQRRKMSKSLGNSPDALKLIADYGADGVRVGLLLSSAAGNDLLFDEALCQQGKGFGNKLWNAFQLVKGWQVDSSVAQPAAAQLALQWFEAKFNAVLTEVEDHFEKYRISDALMAIYKLTWDDFCAWLLEMVKPEYGKPMDKATYEGVVAAFENLLKLLHPFMPFLTEEIWQSLAPRTPEQALIVATYPTVQPYDEKLLAEFDFAAEVIAGIRTVRKEKNIPFKTPLSLSVLNKEQMSNRFDVVISKMGGLEAITEVSTAIEGAMSFRVKANEYFIPMEGAVNVEEELKKLQEELTYTQGFLASVRKKLSNEKFVNSAPAQVVDNERKKEADALAKIETLEKAIKAINS